MTGVAEGDRFATESKIEFPPSRGWRATRPRQSKPNRIKRLSISQRRQPITSRWVEERRSLQGDKEGRGSLGQSVEVSGKPMENHFFGPAGGRKHVSAREQAFCPTLEGLHAPLFTSVLPHFLSPPLVHSATCRIPFGKMTRKNNSLFLFLFVLLIEHN